ncbi:hypothetical protein D4R54_01105 [archaeon]|nr:MAG: hypothetical protein D4R54_01105 [archaeon]
MERTIVEASVLLITLLFLMAQIPSFSGPERTSYFSAIAIPLTFATFVSVFSMAMSRLMEVSYAFRCATTFLEAGLFVSGVGALAGFLSTVVNLSAMKSLVPSFASPVVVLVVAILLYIGLARRRGQRRTEG